MADNGDIDRILERRGAESEPDPALVERVRNSLLPSLRPVHPLPPRPVFISLLVLVFAAVAIAGGAGLGLYGVDALNVMERWVIFALLAASGLLAAIAVTGEMVPAGVRLAHPAVIAAAGIVGFAAAFALLFHDYSTEDFASGIVCLEIGLAAAAPAALLIWLILRRGFITDSVAAGAAVGTLAGLAGLAVLELHCPILEVPHVLVWHIAVLLLAAAAGALAGCLRRS